MVINTFDEARRIIGASLGAKARTQVRREAFRPLEVLQSVMGSRDYGTRLIEAS
jgi:hypothetical protein